MDNIEKSEVVIARILSKSLDSGIKNNDLEFEDLELPDDYAPYFTTCIDWLINENLIRVANHHKYKGGSLVLDITLTSYGFTVMGQKFLVSDEDISIGQAVKKVSESQSGYSRSGDFVGGVLGGFSKSILS